MSKYRLDANNDLGSSDLFHRRLLYKFFAMSTDGETATLNKPGVKDYWNFEDYFYGKVDPNFIPAIPNVDYMVQLEAEQGTILVFDFVAESFNKFKSLFKLPLKFGKLEQGTPLTSPTPHRGFINTETLYQNHMISMMDKFNNFLYNGGKYKKIIGPKDYTKEFFKFYFRRRDIALKSSFYLSSNSPSGGSGLSINIANLNPADDRVKMEIIESPNFEFYRKAAINSGFLIDKNIPWRLNIDLSSPVIVGKYPPSPLVKIDFKSSMFDEYFTPAYEGELQDVVDSIFYGYRTFYDRLPLKNTFFSDGRRCEDSEMTPPSELVISNLFPTSYWTGKYVEMKNKETGNHFDKQEVEAMKRNAVRIQTESSESYINRKFSMPWLSPTSLVYQRLQREFEESDEKVLDNFSEHVKMIVMNSINSIY